MLAAGLKVPPTFTTSATLDPADLDELSTAWGIRKLPINTSFEKTRRHSFHVDLVILGMAVKCKRFLQERVRVC